VAATRHAQLEAQITEVILGARASKDGKLHREPCTSQAVYTVGGGLNGNNSTAGHVGNSTAGDGEKPDRYENLKNSKNSSGKKGSSTSGLDSKLHTQAKIFDAEVVPPRQTNGAEIQARVPGSTGYQTNVPPSSTCILATAERLGRWRNIAIDWGWTPGDITPRPTIDGALVDAGFIGTVTPLLDAYPDHEAIVVSTVDLTMADMSVMTSKSGRGPSAAQSILFQRAEDKIQKRIIRATTNIEAGKAKVQQIANGSGSTHHRGPTSKARLFDKFIKPEEPGNV
jgi:hypothetical protein